VEIKPGYKEGTKIRFAGEGDQQPGFAPQDIVFVVQQKPHEFYTRDGNDLVYKADITLPQALTGVKLTLPTLDGRQKEIIIRDVIYPGYEHIVPGEGMPTSKDPSRKGNLRVRFNVRFPRNLTEEQRDVLKKTFKGMNLTY